jgi:hypothetical protein
VGLVVEVILPFRPITQFMGGDFQIREDLVMWLRDQGVDDNWRYVMTADGLVLYFRFEDPKTAVLFKLRWA